MCFAVDIHVLAADRDWSRTSRLAEIGVAAVAAMIRRLELQIAPQSWIRVGDIKVQVDEGFKYLGLHLDSHWHFRRHFDCLAPRLDEVANVLGRVLPNIVGSSEKVRRLYTGIVRNIALYGSPIWDGALMASRRSQVVLR
uniref:uncharacterized protein LOC117610573 n=1 Tax=Osmia lignaria TaxID=473952 RepID=UPI0014796FF2|nr:uncharacterized protein LOC117610573 [Osmia lignaria]